MTSSEEQVSRSPNQAIADMLREGASLLAKQDANPFRVGAYRHAADTVAALGTDLREIFEDRGSRGLVDLPDIGRGIAAAIVEILTTGRWSLLDRLRGDTEPERLFQTIPGVGPHLAQVLHERLGVDTLEALETAAYDGRLEMVPGVGPRRSASLRASLSNMLARLPRPAASPRTEPAVGVVLDVDEEYRRRDGEGGLPAISPRRFNPGGDALIPVLHTLRGPWHFTALFSNTPRAHELGRTRDWVVLYFYDDHHQEGQCTVVTESHGPLAGRRVVRGREQQCLDHYLGAASETDRKEEVE